MKENPDLYQEFIAISQFLNRHLHITPVLYGSLGLTKVTNINFSPQDIDILIPCIFLQEKWGLLKQAMKEQGYSLINLAEHEFQKRNIKIGFSFIEDLENFAGIDYKKLELLSEDEAMYYRLSLTDYMKVYQKSSQDGYRRTRNNHKDREKLEILNKLADLKDK